MFQNNLLVMHASLFSYVVVILRKKANVAMLLSASCTSLAE